MRILKRDNRSTGAEQVGKGPYTAAFADIHCHCLPGLDDGPADPQEALSLCRALVADGIRTVVATPHQLGRYEERNGGPRIRRVVEQFRQVLAEAHVALTVLPGADVRIDERIPALLEAGEVLTIGDQGRYLLLELPHEVFVDPLPLLASLAEIGVTAIITHPERQPFLARNPSYVQRWVQHRPGLQLTATSLDGGFGRLSESAAWALLREPLPVLVATDAHDVSSRPPRLTQAYAALCERLGRSAAQLVCRGNPQRVLSGQDLCTLAWRPASGEVRR